ncbi:MAG: hypothetical protein AB1801_04935 [Chloroflexota bacterium]
MGPFYDLARFVVGLAAAPPPSRVLDRAELAAAGHVLTGVGCDLSRCTAANLHTFPVDIEPDLLFDLLLRWQQWPCSSFFPCLSRDEHGVIWFAYRWWKIIPIVIMKLRAAEKPRYLIYDIVWGIGPGGYHSFLIGQADPARTTLSIFTTFPQTWLFPEGLHDRVNYDIYRKLRSSNQRRG